MSSEPDGAGLGAGLDQGSPAGGRHLPLSEFDPHVEAVGGQLREKIASKFQTAAFLGGFGFTTLSIQFTLLFQTVWPKLLPWSIGLMIAATVLYFWGLYSLDSLTMPKRFWKVDGARAAPTPSKWVLGERDLFAMQKRMVFYWHYLVLPAMAATALSLVLMLVPTVAATAMPDGQDQEEAKKWWTLWVATGAAVVAVAYCIILSQGISDISGSGSTPSSFA